MVKKNILQFNMQLIAKLNILSEKLRSLQTVAYSGFLRRVWGGSELMGKVSHRRYQAN